MKNQIIVRPVGLKGNEVVNRMKELMGNTVIKENVKTSVVELTKMGPDGKVYGIVRENHEFYIKVATKTSNLVAEDFNYIGGLQNKKQEAYPTYAKATKQLNLKFMSLNEACESNMLINILKNDNLLAEHHAIKADTKLSATKGMGNAQEYVTNKKGKELSIDAKEDKETSGDNLADGKVINDVDDVELTENEEAIDEMLDPVGKEDKDVNNDGKVDNQDKYIKNKRMKISTAIDKMDEAIDEATGVIDRNKLIEALSEAELVAIVAKVRQDLKKKA